MRESYLATANTKPSLLLKGDNLLTVGSGTYGNTASPSNATNKAVTWKSSNTKTASCKVTVK